MSSRKLSEQDIHELLDLYRQPGETTSTLASRYGVSNSTVSRVLKNSLPEAEYETLVQQKRSSRSQASIDPEPMPEPIPEPPAIVAEEAPSSKPKPSRGRKTAKPEAVESPEPEIAPAPKAETPKPTKKKIVLPAVSEEAIASDAEPSQEKADVGQDKEPADSADSGNSRRVRKRSSQGVSRERSRQEEDDAQLKLELPSLNGDQPGKRSQEASDQPKQSLEIDTIEDELGYLPESQEDLDDEEDDEDLDDLDDLDDDDFDDDEDDDEDDEDDELGGAPKLRQRVISTEIVKILPFAEASLPKVSYLVVDRLAELVARPLREFGDLGQIPEAEVQEKTLPIFDNHRVARRFSKRNQRVIKVPDSNMFQKALPYLQAKGITRLLIDGQVYDF